MFLISEFTLKLKRDFTCHISVGDPDHRSYPCISEFAAGAKGRVN